MNDDLSQAMVTLEDCQQHMQNADWQKAIDCLQTLQQQHPENKTIPELLEEAQIKADVEASARHIQPRRWTAPVGRYAIWIGIIVILAAFIVIVLNFVNSNILPAIAKTRNEQHVQQLLEDGWTYLSRGDIENATKVINEAGHLDPGNPKILDALGALQRQRQAETLYQKGVELQKQGQYDEALQAFTEYIIRSRFHRDAPQRITQIKRIQTLSQLFEQAEAAFQAGNYDEAISLYQELRTIDRNYQAKIVSQRLYEAYMALGYHALREGNGSAHDVQQALDYFKQALAEKPRDDAAQQEKTLADLYLKALKAIDQHQWLVAADHLSTLYQQQPDYLKGRIPEMLYEALVKGGDMYRALDDIPMAYEQYRKACQIDVPDHTLCQARINEVAPLLTPTPTPTATPTPSPTPTITPTPTPAPPTPTPRPLPLLKGKIAFYSENPIQPGVWVMDANGRHRQYYGRSHKIVEEFESMFEKYRVSPDGRYRAYVTKGPGDKTPQIYIQGQVNQYGIAPTWKVTKGFSRVCYDPMWSPDGAKLVFVSEENGSDDIWVINIDGSNPIDLTPNTWEWDKHPSWSPDGRRIVFWSNRTGVKNIYVMDADGSNVRNISNTDWDEWKPLWIR